MVGKIIPNYLNKFPTTSLHQTLSLNIGTFKTSNLNAWAKYYNFPQTGVNINYSNLGNNKIFGHEISVLAFISFNVFNTVSKPYYLKIGIGAAYFTTHFDSISNPKNVAIGSPLAWSFKAGAYKTIAEKNGLNLKLGLVFLHGSNGHTQLPNFGVNSALISLSSQFYNKDLKQYQLKKNKPPKKNKLNQYGFGINYGLGVHEYGDKDGPIGGAKKGVHSLSVFAEKTDNNHFKWGLGLTYRYYPVYAFQIENRQLTDYLENKNLSASNVTLFTKAELLMSHVSINMELGVNLYKPFYQQFETDFPLGNDASSFAKINSTLTRIISTRLGLNLYLFNTNKLPKHNLFIGPYIKANFSQADFSELAAGYVYNFN
ncbi:MAG: acyloxyacyl hydrolase [Vicingaceae bacterium]